MNSLVSANRACLQQGISFLESVPRDIYGRSCEEVFNSSIGGHIRHNLDHYAAFLDGFEDGRIDYDARRREADIEEDPLAAVELSRRLLEQMSGISEADPDRPLEIRMDDGGDSCWSRTSPRRELQFLLSHTIHHYALIVCIATRYGVSDFPESFGIAPSTISYRKSGRG